MPIFVVDREFSPPVTPEQFAGAGEKLAPCIQEREVKHIASHLATDGTRSVCVFEAADAERVREANRTAGAPFTRVWSANLYRP